MKHRVVWKLQYDTYQRENDRYTEVLIDFSEHLFYLQSQFFVFNDKTFFSRDLELKFFESIKILDYFVSIFLESDQAKLNFYELTYEKFKHEFQNSKILTKELNQFFKDNFSKILKNNQTNDSELKGFTKKVRLAVNVYNVNLENISIDVLSSHTHMLVNRYFSIDQRKYEYMIYHHLFKFYSYKKWHTKM